MKMRHALVGLAAVSLMLTICSNATAQAADNNYRAACYYTPDSTSEAGVACARGTVTGSFIACESRDRVYGCSIRVTVSDAQDPETCGRTTVVWEEVRVVSSGCGGSLGGTEITTACATAIADVNTESIERRVEDSYRASSAPTSGCTVAVPGAGPRPVPATGDLNWKEAERNRDTGVWYVAHSATVAVELPPTVAPINYPGKETTVIWDVLFEVPSPPANDPASASVDVGMQSTGMRLAVPEARLVIEEYVSPMDIISQVMREEDIPPIAKTQLQIEEEVPSVW